jgi:hypothetical protein
MSKELTETITGLVLASDDGMVFTVTESEVRRIK